MTNQFPSNAIAAISGVSLEEVKQALQLERAKLEAQNRRIDEYFAERARWRATCSYCGVMYEDSRRVKCSQCGAPRAKPKNLWRPHPVQFYFGEGPREFSWATLRGIGKEVVANNKDTWLPARAVRSLDYLWKIVGERQWRFHSVYWPLAFVISMLAVAVIMISASQILG